VAEDIRQLVAGEVPVEHLIVVDRAFVFKNAEAGLPETCQQMDRL
jgi:hypothetical protein